MTDEPCRHETTSGGACQNPTTEDGDPGRCWIPSHNDADAENPTGRHSKFTAERAEEVKQAARQGMSKAGCARAAGVGEATLQRWLEDNDEFRSGFTRARSEGEQKLVTGPLFSDEEASREMDGQHARFLLSTSFDYQKTEKKELEDVTEGDGGFGPTIVLDSEYVED